MNPEITSISQEAELPVQHWQRINALIADNASRELSPEVQSEIGRLVNLLKPLQEFRPPRAGKPDLRPYMWNLMDTSLTCLLVPKPNLIVARDTRRELEDIVLRRNALTRSFFSFPPASKVLLGLLTSLTVIICIATAWHTLSNATVVLGLRLEHLVLAMVFGCVGSVISILVRISSFNRREEDNSSTLFFIGCFRPIIGMGFAWFVYCMIRSRLLPLEVHPVHENNFFVVTAFLSGFSERFGADIIARAENVFKKEVKEEKSTKSPDGEETKEVKETEVTKTVPEK
jgi:hypothetical protein